MDIPEDIIRQSTNLRNELKEQLEIYEGVLSAIKDGMASGPQRIKNHLAEKMAAVTEPIGQLEETVKELNDRLDEIMGTTEQLVESITEFPSLVAEKLEEGREAIVEVKEALSSLQIESTTTAEANFKTGQELVTEALNGGKEQVQSQLENAREVCSGRLNELRDVISNWREQTGERIEQIMRTDLADKLTAKTEAFTSSLEKLNDAGGEELSKLTKAIGGIEKSADQILDLIESVKPVLELARTL